MKPGERRESEERGGEKWRGASQNALYRKTLGEGTDERWDLIVAGMDGRY